MNQYTLDANILINFERWYPRKYFSPVWTLLEDLVAQDRACICFAVEEEVKRGTGDLHSWVKSLDGFIHNHGDAEFKIVQKIAQDYPEWVREYKNAADPFVIAHASSESRLLVTQEKRKGAGVQAHNLAIPNVADEYNVQCIRLFDLFDAENWSL